jgi:Cu+-exporting ATPase
MRKRALVLVFLLAYLFAITFGDTYANQENEKQRWYEIKEIDYEFDFEEKKLSFYLTHEALIIEDRANMEIKDGRLYAKGGKSFRFGSSVLVKSAEALELMHSIDTMVLDKTGTITEGKPKVTDIMPFGVDEKELLIIAASIEKPSEHPLAEAILAKAKDNALELVEVESFNAVPGRGITAIIDGKSYVAGNIEMMRDNSIKVPDSVNGNNLSQEGKTPLYFAKENTFIGVIAVADTVKESSKSAIKELKDMGIDVIMLTGDNETTAKAVAGSLQIDNVVADVMPQDKESIVRKLQEEGKKVAMVGDGINDAPALVRADVGIAINAGTDIAIESADIVLMRSDLNDAVFAVKLGKATIKNIKQNLFWAFFYNTLGIPLAAGVFYPFFGLKLSPMIGALAMSLSSVFVVTNALRLRFFNRE